MGVNNSWRQPQTMSDWMRDIEKRLMHEERRPQHAKASDVVGSGIGVYSRLVEDWNSEGPVVDGFFYSIADSVIQSPDDSKNWMGIVQANSVGQGLQRVWEYIDDPVTPSPDPGLFTRSFVTNADGSRNYTPWLQGGGGAPGSGQVTIQDEGTTIGLVGQLDFYGAGVTALMGTGEVQLTIDGVPKGNVPPGGALAGSYPSPTLAPGAIPPIGVQDENVTVVSPLTMLDFQGPGVTVTVGAAGEAIVSIAGGGGGVGGVGQAGEMSLWGTNLPPADWLLCDGRAVSRTLYPDLFNAIGTRYGVGDGSTTFNLPNMQSRFPLGASPTYPLASTGGTTQHSHTADIDHQHSIGHTHGATGDAGSTTLTNVPTTGGQSATRPSHTHSTGQPDWALSGTQGGTATTTQNDTNPPYLALNYIIRYQTTAMVPGTVMIQEENASVAAADIINFIGAGVTATDAGGGKVDVTIGGGGTVLNFPAADVVWVGAHNLNQKPVDVTLMNAAGEKFIGNVLYPDNNTVRAEFGVAVAGSMLVQK